MHHLVLRTGRDHAWWRGLRAVLEAHEHHHLSAEDLLRELDRLLAAAIEEQVGLDVHSISLSVVRECAPTDQSNDGQQNRQVASIFLRSSVIRPQAL